jgi:hypothetical protein
MKALGGILGLVLALAVGYYVYTASLPTERAASPKRQIDSVGVKSDLLSIAQAERLYLASHGSYAPIEELERSGAISFSPSSHRGYTYSSATDGALHFRITARPLDPARADWPTLSIDETMQLSPQ